MIAWNNLWIKKSHVLLIFRFLGCLEFGQEFGVFFKRNFHRHYLFFWWAVLVVLWNWVGCFGLFLLGKILWNQKEKTWHPHFQLLFESFLDINAWNLFLHYDFFHFGSVWFSVIMDTDLTTREYINCFYFVLITCHFAPS